MEAGQESPESWISVLSRRALSVILGYAFLTDCWNRWQQFPEHPVRNALFTFALLLVASALGWVIVARPDRLSAATAPLGKMSWKTPFVLGLILRVTWVLVSHVQQTSDFAFYDGLARDIASGVWSPSPFFRTGQSLVFALHYKPFGYHPVLPQLTLAVLVSLQIPLVHHILRRTDFPQEAAVLAALLLSVWPEHVLYCNLLGNDTLFSTAILAAVWALLPRGETGPQAGVGIFAAGLCLGLAHWFRGTTSFFWLGAFLFLLLQPDVPGRRRALNLSLCGAGILCFLVPMVFFNWAYFGEPSVNPNATVGANLLSGTHLPSHGVMDPDQDVLLEEARRVEGATGQTGYQAKDEAGRKALLRSDRMAKEQGLQRLRDHGASILWMALRYKIGILWSAPGTLDWSLDTSILAAKGSLVKLAAYGWHKLLLVPAVLGLWMLPRTKGNSVLLIYSVAAVLTAAAHLLLSVQPRYKHMFLPYLAMMAAVALAPGKISAPGRDQVLGDPVGGAPVP